MSKHKSPFLPSHFLLLPRNGNYQVVDFWANLFSSAEPVTSQIFAQFPVRTAEHLQIMGYKGDTHGETSIKSLSGGLIGVGREMRVFSNAHAKAVVYFKVLEDFYYVSLRVIYPQPFSILKIIRFVLLVLALTLFFGLFDFLQIYFSPYYSYGYYANGSIEDMLRQAFGYFALYLFTDTAVFLSGFFAVSLFVIWGLVSWFRTGKFLAFLREDFQEVYRDDLASIGYAAYNAIMTSADELSLKIIQPDDVQPPAFGTGADNSRSRRPQRI